MVERISNVPLTCSQFARSELNGYLATQLSESVIVYTETTRSREAVVLVNTPPSCLILRRQVQFRWGSVK